MKNLCLAGGVALNCVANGKVLRDGHFERIRVQTTDSNHSRPIYTNLAAEMVLTGIDQLWVAYITYIRLEVEFVYLAVVLDTFSRRVIGWHRQFKSIAASKGRIHHRAVASVLSVCLTQWVRAR